MIDNLKENIMKNTLYYGLITVFALINVKEIAFDQTGVFFNFGEHLQAANLKKPSLKEFQVSSLINLKTPEIDEKLFFKRSKPFIGPTKKDKLEDLPIQSPPVKVLDPEPVKIANIDEIEQPKPIPVRYLVPVPEPDKSTLEVAQISNVENLHPAKEIKQITNSVQEIAPTCCSTHIYGKKKFKPHKYWKQQRRGRR